MYVVGSFYTTLCLNIINIFSKQNNMNVECHPLFGTERKRQQNICFVNVLQDKLCSNQMLQQFDFLIKHPILTK